MSTPQRAARRTKKPFDRGAFEELHEVVGKLDFTPDFNPAIEAILDMPDVALVEKVMALVKLQAWGNQKLFAVHDYARNKPFTEADCARRLDVRRQRINEELKKLVARCQLRIDGGKLYPVADPEIERIRKNDEVVRNGGASPSPNLRFLKHRWFAEHPEIHDQYQKAFQFIASVNKQIEIAIREMQLSDPLAVTADEPAGERPGHVLENGPDTPDDPLRTIRSPILKELEVEVEELSSAPPPTLAPDRENLALAIREAIGRSKLAFEKPLDDWTIANIAKRIAPLTMAAARAVLDDLEEECGKIQNDQRRKQQTRGWGVAVQIAKDAVKRHRSVESERLHELAKPPQQEATSDEVEAMLADLRAMAAGKGKW